MEEIKKIIDLLEKIRVSNKKTFNSCPDEKLLKDTDYGMLYQALWQADFRLKNIIDLLRAVDSSV
ncbi:MAG: hypothetical protein ACOYWZ_06120 [Bacillota bacterium]